MRARRKQATATGRVLSRGTPWLLTLADLMTLLLTFFVILVSLSVFDEDARQRVMESVHTVFSIQDSTFFPFSVKTDDETPKLNPPDLRDESLVNISRLLAENGVREKGEFSLSRNNQVIVITLGNGLLFSPAQTTLSPQGRTLLAALAPYLTKLEHPLRIAAHGTPGLEDGQIPPGSAAALGSDLPRALSLERAQAVYRFLAAQGVNAALLRMEAYGADRPRFSNQSSQSGQSNRQNRRVELVLDRRDRVFAQSDGFRASPYEAPGDFEMKYPEPALPEASEPALPGGAGNQPVPLPPAASAILLPAASASLVPAASGKEAFEPRAGVLTAFWAGKFSTVGAAL